MIRTPCLLLVTSVLLAAAGPAFPQMGEFAAPVQIAEVTRVLLPQRVDLFGTVQPFRRSAVATEVEGIVEDFPFVEGDLLENGEIAVFLRNRTFHIERDAALASLRAASAELERLRNGYRPWEIQAAQARLEVLTALADDARSDFQRSKQLISEGAATEEDLENAETDLAAALSRIAEASANLSLLREGYRAEEIERARAEVQLRSAELDRIEDQIDKTRVRAPFSGAISKKTTEIGEWVGEGDPAFELIQVDPVLILVDVPEQYLSGLHVGRPAVVLFDALPGLELEGKVTRLIPDANVSARTFPARIEIANTGGMIRAGMLARVDLEVGEPREAVVVPKDAIVLSARGNSVFTVVDGRARNVPVELGDSSNGYVAIRPELEVGTPVVVRGNERLREGQQVLVEPPETTIGSTAAGAPR